MFNSFQRLFTLLLIALLAVCWIVGEAWHLVPGLGHIEEHCGGYCVVGAMPEVALGPPCQCKHGGCQRHEQCPLPILSADECPVCRLIAELLALSAAIAVEPPLPLVQDLPAVRSTFFLPAATRLADARAPPA